LNHTPLETDNQYGSNSRVHGENSRKLYDIIITRDERKTGREGKERERES
jgi:hypothetical protein